MTTSHKSLARFSTLLLVAALLLGSLLPAAPLAAQDAPPPAGDAAAIEGIERPALRTVTPEEGAAWNGEDVTWSFDRWVGISTYSITPALAGSWQVLAGEADGGSTVTFLPETTPEPGVRYRLRFQAYAVDRPELATAAAEGDVDTTAEAAALSIEHLLTGAVPLAVTATTPSDGASEVATSSQIVVTFNRPVVPLTGASEAEQATLPQPLAFEPPLEGAGRWLTTSIYAFNPEPGMAGATDYTVAVATLTAVGGESLAEPFAFSFSTAAPIVENAYPQGNNASPFGAVQVTFSQAMNAETTQAAFALRRAGEGSGRLPGRFAWDELGRTLTFTPTGSLVRGATYEIAVDGSAQPASGSGGLRESFSGSFTVAPLPAVLRTTPVDGDTGVLPEQQVMIRFPTVMSRETLAANVTISPLLTTTSVYSWYNDWEGELSLEWQKQANTEYTVTIGAAAQDLYGKTLGSDTVLRFTTGDHSPFVRMDLPNFTHFTAVTDTNVSLFYRNVDELEVALYELPVSEYLLPFSGPNAWESWTTYSPDETALLWSRTYTTTDIRNETYQRVITLDDGEGNILPAGLYLVRVAQPAASFPTAGETSPPVRSLHIVAIGNNSLVVKKSMGGQSLAWVTNALSGEPVAGAEVYFETAAGAGASATAGDDGVALATLALDGDATWLPLVAWTGEPGDETFAIASSEWNEGVAPWDFNISGGYAPDEIQSLFYTDRPLYRPGQTVYWKGIVRRLVDDVFMLPEASATLTVTVRNERGDAIQSQVLPFGANGTVDGAVRLPPDSFGGWYYLEALLPYGKDAQGNDLISYGGAGFQVASYVKPEFEVRVTPQPSEVTQGENVRVLVEADYFSGGALADAPLSWNIIAEPYFFAWEDAPDGRWFTFTPWDPAQDQYDPYALPLFGLVKSGKGQTDANGDFVLEVPADLGAALQSQQWRVAVTVQSPTNQFVDGDAPVVVHRGDFYVGLSPRSYVAPAGEDALVDVVALTTAGEPLAGQALEATIYEFQWNNVQEQAADGRFVWTSTAERTAVDAQRVTTDEEGLALVSFAPARGGQYQIVVEGDDAGGNRIGSATYLWVADSDPTGYTPWQRENNDRIELVADKRSYQPGDTAQILVPSPFQGETLALVTIERTGVVEHRLETLSGNSATIEVPIMGDHVPNIFVGVVLVKGVDETNPAPAINIGYVQLDVGTESKELTLDVTVATGAQQPPGEAPSAQPGEVVTYTLDVTDHDGEPVAGAEVSLALVDKALLTLAQMNAATLVDTFYRTRPLGVTTGATLVINRDRMAQQLSEGAKGGGGGGGDGGLLDVREEFPDTALWHAALVSDENGQIQFGLTLPDNLTTWSLSARAVTADTLVGETTHELVVTKPLQVRPLLPRFFTAGDRAQLGAQVLNTSGVAIESATYTVTVEGATLEGDASGELRFGADGSAPNAALEFAVSVPSESSAVTVTIQALAASADGPLGDAMRRVLPVVRYTTPEVVGSAGSVAESAVVEYVQVPAAATEQGALIIGIEPSLAAGMTQGLDYLRHFPWECTEQTVSRFLPNVFTARAIEELGLVEMGLAGEALVGDLDVQLGTGVQALAARQNADGGWGNWPGESSDRFITAWALWGLWHAAEAGREVPGYVLDSAIEYLDRSFVQIDAVIEGANAQSTLNSLAFTHLVLAEMGEGDPGRMSTLYDVRERLDHHGRAWLAMALAAESPDDPRVQTLLDDLAGAAIQTGTAAWWQEESLDLQGLNTDVRTTAIILDAFSRLRPDAPLLPNVVRWLMQVREAGIWSNTQENAWALIALTDWMTASGELEADYTWQVALNGALLGEGEANPTTLLERTELRAAVADLLRDDSNAVALSRDNASGRMDYTLHLAYFLDALAVDSADHGIVVDRSFSVNGEPVTSAQVGDIISVTVTVVAPTMLHQLLVEVPIPAGAEVIDPNLAGAAALDPWGVPLELPGWKSWRPSYRDFRDERVALFDTQLAPGTWQYTFNLRATVPGEFRVLPGHAEMLYFREVWGRSAGALFRITE